MSNNQLVPAKKTSAPMAPFKETPAQLVPFKEMSAQMSPNCPTTFIYNEGEVTADPTVARNFAIWNTPGSKYNATPSRPKTCHICGECFSSEAAKAYHKQDKPLSCGHHRMCFDNWKTHIERESHNLCPLPRCPRKGEDFGSAKRFLRHWHRDH